MSYDFPIDDVKVKPHQLTTLHMICALAFIVAGAIAAVYNFDFLRWWGLGIGLAGLLLAIVVMAKNKWVISRNINPIFRVLELLVTGLIVSYSSYTHWKFPIVIFSALGVFLLFALFWERTAGVMAIHLDKEGIKFPPTARRRFRPWTEIDEVILRFGILTVNCADNTLLQWTIAGTEVDTEIFEAWCSAQVEANRSKRIADW